MAEAAPQCKARTGKGTRCVRPIVPPSGSLCKRHQNLLAGGSAIINAETGRRVLPPR